MNVALLIFFFSHLMMMIIISYKWPSNINGYNNLMRSFGFYAFDLMVITIMKLKIKQL